MSKGVKFFLWIFIIFSWVDGTTTFATKYHLFNNMVWWYAITILSVFIGMVAQAAIHSNE